MIFAFGDCELDTETYELRRRGTPRPVEPQVLDLLLHLVRNHRRLVSKDDIYETIWKGRVVSDSALSSRINAARRAIGDRGSEGGYIRTVFRRGFRFVGAVTVRASSTEATSVSSPTRVAAGWREARREHSASSRAYLRGHFACYSWAWSPVFPGKLIRGSLILEASSASSPMSAVYAESLSHQTLRHRGFATFADQAMYLDLIDERTGSRAFVNLLCPGPPATVMVGVMSGKVFHDPTSEIGVARILAIRVPRAAQGTLERSNRYLDPAETAVSSDLRSLGLALGEAPHLDSLFQDFLKGGEATGFFRVTATENQALNVGIDRALAETGRAGSRQASRSAPRGLPAY